MSVFKKNTCEDFEKNLHKGEEDVKKAQASI